MSRLKRTLDRMGVEGLAALFVLALLTHGYVTAMRAGAWPPGHPWSGITLLLLSIQVLFLRSSAKRPSAKLALWIVTALTVASATCWFIGTHR